MARFAGVDIPNEKRIVISLTYVFGVGLQTSKKVLAAAGEMEKVKKAPSAKPSKKVTAKKSAAKKKK